MKEKILKHKRAIITAFFVVLILLKYIFILYMYKFDNNVYDVEGLTSFIHKSYDLCGKEWDVYGDNSLTYLVRLNSNFMNNPENKSDKKISSMEEMEDFVDEMQPDGVQNKWVKYYIRYSAWQWAEFLLDEDSDDYWHMKYVSSQKVAECNYKLIVEYKVIGFLIKYSSAIIFITQIIVNTIFGLWVFLTISKPFRKTKAKY